MMFMRSVVTEIMSMNLLSIVEISVLGVEGERSKLGNLKDKEKERQWLWKEKGILAWIVLLFNKMLKK